MDRKSERKAERKDEPERHSARRLERSVEQPAPDERPAGLFGRRGIRIGAVRGIELRADWSLLIIFALIAFNLGAGLFPRWHPGWSPVAVWGLAVAAALLFFASIAVHELSHALVGRATGTPIRRITLFVFGGVAHMESEPPSPKAEFLMAAVGPLTSLVIGVVATALGVALGGPVLEQAAEDPEAAARGLGGLATLLLWLGPINILLALFNMVPGFPLDGGRVLRSILWWVTGDLLRATRMASGVGKLVAWALMAAGVFMMFGNVIPGIGGGLVQGLWFLLIGWFLLAGARMGYEQLLIRQALEDATIRDLLRTSVEVMPPRLPVGSLVSEFVRHDQSSFPVVEDDELVGLVHMNDVKRMPRERWDEVQIADIMTPTSRLETASLDDEAWEVFRKLAEHEQIPVVESGRLLGVVRRRDMLRWVALRTPTGRKSGPGSVAASPAR